MGTKKNGLELYLHIPFCIKKCDYCDFLSATLLSVYGFIMGLLSFSEEGRSHKTSIIGSISNGLFLIVWIGVYLTGL